MLSMMLASIFYFQVAISHGVKNASKQNIIGSFQIIGKVSSVTYYLDLLTSYSIHPMVYISPFKKYEQTLISLNTATLAPILMEGQEQFIFDKTIKQ